MELTLRQYSLEDKMLELFDGLISTLGQSKEFKEEDIPSRLIFDMYKMWKSSSSRKFSESASWVDPDTADALLEQGLVQKIISDEGEKYALTFKGIAKCIKIRYDLTLEDQFLRFLELADQGFYTEAQTPLTWREKLATLSLILLASTSEPAAIRLSNETNKAALTEVLQKTLSCLKKVGAIDRKEELTTVKRGENPSSALMCRIDTLARKTRQYYKCTGHSEYFLDIEKEGDIDEKRLYFLLERVFERYDPECNYRETYQDLAGISQFHYPRFLARSVNPTIVLTTLRELREFLGGEILKLPHVMKSPKTARTREVTMAPAKQEKSRAKMGTFWPTVRQRMKERALQLYIKEHPETEKPPSFQELNNKGYLRTAKTMILREIYQERRPVKGRESGQQALGK
jgi:hypothetical protein